MRRRHRSWTLRYARAYAFTQEELEFIESLEQEEELADKQIRFEERKALAAFQTAQIHAREQQQGEQEEPSSR